VVSRDYNQIKDELKEKIDEIRGLREDLEKAKGLLSRQQNRLVVYSSPILNRLQETREEGDDDNGDGAGDDGDDNNKNIFQKLR
jgi:predicted  nucleic acid-binding Zn-ribbon protein